MMRISQWCCLFAVLLIANPTSAQVDLWSELFKPRQGSNATIAAGNETTIPAGGGDANTTLAPTNVTEGTVDPSTTADNVTDAPETDDILQPEGNVTVDDLTDPPLDGNTTAPIAGPNGTTIPPTTTQAPLFLGLFFQFSYGFEAMAAREPTQAEVEEIVCITSQWIRDTVRNATGNNTVESVATNIDWSFDPTPSALQPVSVIFLANTTYNYETPVAPNIVGESTSVSPDQIVQYIANYVFPQVQVADSIFGKITSANFDSPEVTFPLPEGKLDTANCPADTVAPTISPAPTVSPAPSAAPSISSAPTTSPAPSMPPSVSPAPTTQAENTANNGDDSDKSIPPVDGSSQGTTPPGPNAGAGGPTRPPAPDGATRQEIHAKFIVSNLDDWVEPSMINASGLNDAWGPFVAEVVRETAAESRRGLLRESSSSSSRMHRQLRVEYEAGSAHIYDIILVECPEKTRPDLTCHDAYGAFSIFLYDDDRDRPGVQEQKYGNAAVDRIEDGTLQETLDEVKPNSGLYIGALGDPNGGGMALWLLILIILLCILCCCCILGALFFLFVKNKDRDGDKKLDSYDEEGFAYDFLIPPHQKVQTEVDDEVEDASTKDADGDDEEFFEDEAGGAAQAKPDDAAPATKMEEIDGDDEEPAAEVSDEEGVNVTADVTDEDSDNEAKPLVDGDGADSDDEPEMVEVSNEMEGSESFHEPVEENWDDDEGAKDAKDHSDEDWDDEDDEKKK